MSAIQVFTTYPPADASRRLRIDPLVAILQERGHVVKTHTLLTPSMFRKKNRTGRHRLGLALRLAWRLFLRLFSLASVTRSDVVIVHREAFPFFTPLAEKWLAARATSLVVDVDDALYVRPTHVPDWRRWLKSPRAYDGVLCAADVVFAGSPALRERAAAFGATAVLRHTAPPEEVFALERTPASRPTVLWTGSHSTLGSLVPIVGELLDVCEEVDGRLLVLGGPNITSLPSHPRMTAHRWSSRLELCALRRAWLGVMPLPDTEWEAGKSAYKLLLYLAAGVPVLASAIGMNRSLAGAPGVGLLAANADWGSAARGALSSFEPGRGDAARAWIHARLRPERELARAADLIGELAPRPSRRTSMDRDPAS